MKQKLTDEIFITKANTIHNCKYLYNDLYVSSKVKINITCPLHGDFYQRPDHHLQGRGCIKCGKDALRVSKKEFIERANQIHDNQYNYIGELKNLSSSIDIECLMHGVFKQRADTHLSGSGCPKCSGYFQDNNIFLIKANAIHNFKYTYPDIYVNTRSQINICCPKHGLFKQKPMGHLNGQGCQKCSYDDHSLSNEAFINKANKIHNNKYEYIENYNKTNIKLRIKCPTHGIFLQIPQNHLVGHGCPSCSRNISKSEILWLNSLNIPDVFRQKTIRINKKYFKVDALDPNTNTIYEFYGDYWHGNPKKYNPAKLNEFSKKLFGVLYNDTINRENFLKSLGYNIISIWESDWKNELFK